MSARHDRSFLGNGVDEVKVLGALRAESEWIEEFLDELRVIAEERSASRYEDVPEAEN